MIKLETSCKDCIHSDVCRNKDKAENSANKLKKACTTNIQTWITIGIPFKW